LSMAWEMIPDEGLLTEVGRLAEYPVVLTVPSPNQLMDVPAERNHPDLNAHPSENFPCATPKMGRLANVSPPLVAHDSTKAGQEKS